MRLLLLLLAALAVAAQAVSDGLEGQMLRGGAIYAQKCSMCHQANGQGTPPVFPPLAKADWLMADRKRAIHAVVQGLEGAIKVNGQRYANAMPAQVLDDVEVAAVLTFVTNSWGNRSVAFTPEEVGRARASSRFKTYEALVKASAYQPLPTAPAGWTLREVAQLPEFCTRMAGDGRGERIYLLGQNGGVHLLELASGALAPVLRAEEYLDTSRGDAVTLGMTLGGDGALWIVSNQKLRKEQPLVLNEVTIWRASLKADGHPNQPQPWFRTTYPYGIGGYNHGASHIAWGPEGMLYVSSGSRTDGGEPGKDPRYFQGGEVETTACLWRFDPQAEKPQLEVLGSGIRNAYGFAWDAAGNLFTFSNGPDADVGEEMDFIEPQKHYGFPFQFGNAAVKPGFPYPHTPAPPHGLSFTHAVPNLGPDGGFEGTPGLTFDPHSSPGGTIWLGDDFAPPLGGGFLMPRFGNLLAKPRDVGFDLLSVHVEKGADGRFQARVKTVLAPLGRPLDVHRAGPGRVLILEYTRPTNFKDQLGWLPGRVLELSISPKSS